MMNKALKSILYFLVNRNYIGRKYFPEKKLIVSRTKWLNKVDYKEFFKEYKEVRKYLLVVMKRTGKGNEWHISINPKCLGEIKDMLGL